MPRRGRHGPGPARPVLEIKKATHALATGASVVPLEVANTGTVRLRLTGEGGDALARTTHHDAS